MTHPFEYLAASSLDHAARELSAAGVVPMGGGTDLLVAIDEGIVAPPPRTVLDLRTIPGFGEVVVAADGSITIGAAARIDDLAKHDAIRSSFRALSQACAAVGTPALRHMGTLGGNLCQRPRCWYFRRGISCLKSGGSTCPAKEGENQYLAVLDAGPCYAVHPSDPAVVLAALDASVVIVSVRGTRTIPIAQLYVSPSERADRETILEPDELIAAVVLPSDAGGGFQSYAKQMQREAWDFALVSVAACRRRDGAVRMVMGGVAPRPWRVNPSVEEDVASGGLDDDAIATLADRALLDARPLPKNGYKVALAGALLRDAMRAIAAE